MASIKKEANIIFKQINIAISNVNVYEKIAVRGESFWY